jgi:hypothetical protein
MRMGERRQTRMEAIEAPANRIPVYCAAKKNVTPDRARSRSLRKSSFNENSVIGVSALDKNKCCGEESTCNEEPEGCYGDRGQPFLQRGLHDHEGAAQKVTKHSMRTVLKGLIVLVFM